MNEIVCTAYKAINKGSLLGVFNIFIPKWGVEIRNMTLCQKNGSRWVNFPSMEYENKQGEKKYAPYLSFKEPTHSTMFQEKVKRAIEKHASEQISSASVFEDDGQAPHFNVKNKE